MALVTIRSCEGDIFTIDASIASLSPVIACMVEDNGPEEEIPLPAVTSASLRRCLNYCKELHRFKNETEKHQPPSACLHGIANDDELAQLRWASKLLDLDLLHLLAVIPTRVYISGVASKRSPWVDAVTGYYWLQYQTTRDLLPAYQKVDGLNRWLYLDATCCWRVGGSGAMRARLSGDFAGYLRSKPSDFASSPVSAAGWQLCFDIGHWESQPVLLVTGSTFPVKPMIGTDDWCR